jgi:hypothetical protein
MPDGPLDGLAPGLAIKNPPKKNNPKNFNFKFIMKIIQTFLFETDFL